MILRNSNRLWQRKKCVIFWPQGILVQSSCVRFVRHSLDPISHTHSNFSLASTSFRVLRELHIFRLVLSCTLNSFVSQWRLESLRHIWTRFPVSVSSGPGRRGSKISRDRLPQLASTEIKTGLTSNVPCCSDSSLQTTFIRHTLPLCSSRVLEVCSWWRTL